MPAEIVLPSVSFFHLYLFLFCGQPRTFLLAGRAASGHGARGTNKASLRLAAFAHSTLSRNTISWAARQGEPTTTALNLLMAHASTLALHGGRNWWR
jgi:hypothetical protein